MIYFFLGLVIGFLISFFVIKRSVIRNGAGQLKVCQTCPFFKVVDSVSEVPEEEGDVK